MLKYYVGDITKIQEVKYICNAANGIGIMGAGVAGAIRRAGGKDIENQAIQQCVINNVQPGDIYITGAGTLPYKEVIHLCTMKYPGSASNIETIEKCLENLINYCKEEGITDIVLPALGTGIGRVHKSLVAKTYVNMFSQISNITFHILDINADFIMLIDMFATSR